MNAIRIPRDLRNYNNFRSFAKYMGAGPATYIVHELFCFLAYEAEDLSAAGYTTEAHMRDWITRLDITLELQKMVTADLTFRGILEKLPDGRLFCSIFARYNIDAPYLFQGLDISSRRNLFNKAWEGAIDVTKLVPLFALESRAWLGPDGKRMPQPEFELVLATIRMADSITGIKSRKGVEDFGQGIIQNVAKIMRTYGEVRVKAMLREYHVRRHEPKMPLTTEEFFAKFDEVHVLLMPEGGWTKTYE